MMEPNISDLIYCANLLRQLLHDPNMGNPSKSPEGASIDRTQKWMQEQARTRGA